jgi:hypothetical protein
VALLVPLSVFSVVSDSSITFGASAEWSNGNYRYAGGTNPWLLVLSFLVIGLYLWFMRSSVAELGSPMPTVVRRYLAFWMDFCIAMLAVCPVVGLIPTLAEWGRTGEFEWNFERTTYVDGDGIVIAISILLMFIALAFYYALPLVLARPSPGSCVAGYQIVADEGRKITFPIAVGRIALGFVSLCAFYIAPFIARDRKRGKYWVDAVFGTRASGSNRRLI